MLGTCCMICIFSWHESVIISIKLCHRPQDDTLNCIIILMFSGCIIFISDYFLRKYFYGKQYCNRIMKNTDYILLIYIILGVVSVILRLSRSEY